MQSSVRTPVYQKSLDRLIGRVVESNLDQAYKMGERLKRGLTRMNMLFYRVLSQKAVGVTSAPDFGPEIGPSGWKPLSQKYMTQKGNDLFYYNKGELGSWLDSASAAELLGPPKVMLNVERKRVGEIQGFQRTVVRTSTRGKKWIQTLTFADYRSTGMRGFIKSAELIQYLQPSLSVTPFSRMPSGFAGSKSIAVWLTGKQRDSKGKYLAYRFLNFRGREDRPIVSEYLDWWMNVRVKRLVEKFGRLK